MSELNELEQSEIREELAAEPQGRYDALYALIDQLAQAINGDWRLLNLAVKRLVYVSRLQWINWRGTAAQTKKILNVAYSDSVSADSGGGKLDYFRWWEAKHGKKLAK